MIAPDAAVAAEQTERCELCAMPVAEVHDHVVHLDRRSLLCACRGCWLLFTAPGAGGGRYRAVPDRYARVPAFTVSRPAWDACQFPVSVAFVFRNSTLERDIAFYPSPAGATESLLDLGAWHDLVAAHPVLAEVAPDVEAVLLRVTDDASEAYIVPIDACYELVGHVRRWWRGVDGGPEATRAIDGFFAAVRARAR